MGFPTSPMSAKSDFLLIIILAQILFLLYFLNLAFIKSIQLGLYFQIKPKPIIDTNNNLSEFGYVQKSCPKSEEIGEKIINTLFNNCGIDCEIDGKKTKQLGGGKGDGIIKGKTCEIKTARLGSDRKSFQHELGEVPWNSNYMIFLDISHKNS